MRITIVTVAISILVNYQDYSLKVFSLLYTTNLMNGTMMADFYQNRITKQELAQKMKDLGDILNNSWDGIAIVDERGGFVYTNSAFMSIINYTKDELLRKSLMELAVDESKDILKMALIKASRVGSQTNINVVFSSKDKQKIYLKVSLVLMMNGKYFVINAHDYTEKIAKDDILNSYVPSFELDKDGTIISVSDAFLRISGYLKNELLQQNHSILNIASKHGMKFMDLAKTLKMWERYNGIMQGHTKDGGIFWIDTKVKPQINKFGEIIGFAVIAFDISDKIKLIQQNEEILKGSSQKDQTSKPEMIEKSKFLALESIIENLSQNWLDPLNDIGSNVEKLRQSDYSADELKNGLTSISKTIKNLSKNMEKFKKSFQMTERPTPTNIKKILSSIISMLEKNNDRQKIEIRQDLHDVQIINSYPNELLDVVLGIITNSIEAFRKNQIKNPMLDISLSQVENEIVIQLLDNGGGVPEEIIEKIFEPNFSTKNEKGKGLGLYFAKSLIEMHMNGRLNIENNDGYTNASIIIPIK